MRAEFFWNRRRVPLFGLKNEKQKEKKVFGNEDQLRSAVSNLVYNAVNHTPAGTKIEVCWQQTAQGAQFQVSDNGPGIGPEHVPRLTERFYRVDDSRTRSTGGTGLGLALSCQLAQALGGSLKFEHSPLGGLRCVLTFPKNLNAKQK